MISAWLALTISTSAPNSPLAEASEPAVVATALEFDNSRRRLSVDQAWREDARRNQVPPTWEIGYQCRGNPRTFCSSATHAGQRTATEANSSREQLRTPLRYLLVARRSTLLA